MDNLNITATENLNNTNKILLFIFLGVLVITIVLASFYLYTQHGGAKNNKANSLTSDTDRKGDRFNHAEHFVPGGCFPNSFTHTRSIL